MKRERVRKSKPRYIKITAEVAQGLREAAFPRGLVHQI